MDALREFLEDLKQQGLAQGHFLGLLNVLIGRPITRTDGSVVARGLTWRELAIWLKKVRWNKESVRELGLEPENLPPRDRQQYWYTAISRANVGSDKAKTAGDRLAEILAEKGYVIGPAPGT
jgi:hypothetical protein